MTDTTELFDAHAAHYDAARRRLLPSFDAFYAHAVAALGPPHGDPLRVLDLGAGTGLLAGAVRAAFPRAELTLLDGSAAMLEQARQRLGPAPALVHGDLREPLPRGPWDAIVSALAIHHLADEEKVALLARVHAELRPGGRFVNAEQVAAPTAAQEADHRAWHEAAARAAGADHAEWAAAAQRMTHDRCATVAAQRGWLRDAGFVDVRVVFEERRFAVLAAQRADTVAGWTSAAPSRS